MTAARVVFMGTPDFALPTLRALCDADDMDVRLAVTAPPRVRGRGSKPTPSPVHALALEHDLPVVTPARASNPDLLEQLTALTPDLIVVVAYGGKIPDSILALPRLAIVNLHPSLLPAYRGAAPTRYALLHGLRESGNTIQHLSSKWDAGDIILQRREPVLPQDNHDTYSARMAQKGAALMLDALRLLARGQAPRLPQDHDRATFAPKITPADCKIDWTRPAMEIHNRVRALANTPGAATVFREQRLIVLASAPLDIPSDGAPGTIRVTKRSLLVHTGQGQLDILRVKPEGKRAMDIVSFINGLHPQTGETVS